jgi:prolyl-tRNA synthetase
VTVLETAADILRAAADQNCDADGLRLPAAIAPFTVIVTPVHPERLSAAREIYERLLSRGHDALLDDRDVRPGVKFKDADLIGIPYRINVGKKLAEGLVEFVERASRKSTDVPTDGINIPR